MSSETLASLLTQCFARDMTKPVRNEGDLRHALGAYLSSEGWTVEMEVTCAIGDADLVVQLNQLVVVIEVKLALSRRALYEAASQVLAYRQAIDPAAQALVIGYRRPGTDGAITAVESLGVQVVALEKGEQSVGDTEQGIENRQNAGSMEISSQLHLSNLQSVSPPSQPPTLQWHVQAFACSRHITTVSQLVAVTGIPKQSLYQLWRGETAQISLVMLGRLCHGLHARPGDWFVWEDEGLEQRLAWNVAARAKRLGLNPTQLGFRAGLYYQMMQLVWQGTGQSIFIQTLGKLACALTTDAEPFDVGDVFAWATPEGA